MSRRYAAECRVCLEEGQAPMLQTSPSVRTLGPSDLFAVYNVVDRHPAIDVFVGSRVHASKLASSRMGGQLWGYHEGGALTSVCYAGANLVPVAADLRACRVFADLALRRGRRCSSIVGSTDAVLAMWDMLRSDWAPARAIRPRQPVMVIDQLPTVTADSRVRRVRPDEIDRLMPAAIAMFTEEVGVSPTGSDGGANYRARVAELVHAGRAFALFDGNDVVFKAEIAVATPHACQLQGVWVRPDLRGRGLSLGGVAAVVETAIAEIAPIVSLYVNDFNTPALRAYKHVGFREVGQFATVMF